MPRPWLPLLLCGLAFASPTRLAAQPARGRPPQYSGAVGRYSLQATAAPTTLHVEEPTTLRVTISAEGPQPTPPQRPALRLFPAEWDKDFYVEEVPGEDRSNPRKGSWEFVYRLRPKHEQVQAIAGLKLVYYNPARAKYETAYQEPDHIPLTVRPRPQPRADWDVADAAPASLYVLAPVYPITGPPASPRPATDWLILLIAPPFVCWLGSRLVRALWHGARTGLAVHAAAQRALKELDAGTEPVWQVVGRYLRERLSYPGAEPTPGEVALFLKRCGAARPVCTAFRAFCDACDAARFAPLSSDDASRLRGEAARLIESLEADKCLA
jgi:hypothetical protein